MRVLQSFYPRIRDRIQYEERGERKLVLFSCVLLFNLRSTLVGMNQILSVFYYNALKKDVAALFNRGA